MPTPPPAFPAVAHCAALLLLLSGERSRRTSRLLVHITFGAVEATPKQPTNLIRQQVQQQATKAMGLYAERNTRDSEVTGIGVIKKPHAGVQPCKWKHVDTDINTSKSLKIKTLQRTSLATSSADTLSSHDDDDLGSMEDLEDSGARGDASTAPASKCIEPVQPVEKHFQYEIMIWYGATLRGVEFAECHSTGYPCVKATEGSSSLPGMWNLHDGDFLISINGCSTERSTMSYDSAMQIVSNGVRPAVLRFRRPTSREMQNLPIRRRLMPQQDHIARRRTRERHEQTMSYVIWREEDGPLGVSLKRKKGELYPTLAAMNRTSIVNRQAPQNKVSIGDQLLAINQHDVQKLGGNKWMQLMASAPKPLVLTFRRTSLPAQQQGERTLDL